VEKWNKFDTGNTVICTLQKASVQNTNVEIILQRKYNTLLNMHASACSSHFLHTNENQTSKQGTQINNEGRKEESKTKGGDRNKGRPE
jgi:hypothetical protein